MRVSRAVVLVTLVVSVAAAGCGGSSKSSSSASSASSGSGAGGAAGTGGGSKQDVVRATFLKTAEAMARGDGVTACANFSPSVAQTLASSSGSSCQGAVGQLAANLGPSDRSAANATKVNQVTVTGDRATIMYQLNSGLKKLGFTGMSRLVQSGGRWLIAPRSGH